MITILGHFDLSGGGGGGLHSSPVLTPLSSSPKITGCQFSFPWRRCKNQCSPLASYINPYKLHNGNPLDISYRTPKTPSKLPCNYVAQIRLHLRAEMREQAHKQSSQHGLPKPIKRLSGFCTGWWHRHFFLPLFLHREDLENRKQHDNSALNKKKSHLSLPACGKPCKTLTGLHQASNPMWANAAQCDHGCIPGAANMSLAKTWPSFTFGPKPLGETELHAHCSCDLPKPSRAWSPTSAGAPGPALLWV